MNDDPNSVADALERHADWEETPPFVADDLYTAARLLRHHAALTDAIGDPDELRCVETDDDDFARYLYGIADAVQPPDPKGTK
jgi:hypothetical protein